MKRYAPKRGAAHGNGEPRFMCAKQPTGAAFGAKMELQDWSLTMNLHTSPVAEVQQVGLSAADHMMGLEDAPFTLLQYGDYECPHCVRAEPKVRRLVDTFGPQLRFVFRHLPLMALHPHAELAAEAAEAAAAQGKFWAMHRLLFGAPNHLTLADLTKHAQFIGLDMIRFHAEMADHIYTQRVQEHRRAAALSDVHTTPTFILNGRVIDTSSSFDELEVAVLALSKPHAV
jgi:protein-disulfide isomerase